MYTKLHPALIFSLIISPSFMFSSDLSVVSTCLVTTLLVIVVLIGAFVIVFTKKESGKFVIFVGIACVSPGIMELLKRLHQYFSGQIQTIPLKHIVISPEFSNSLIIALSLGFIAFFSSVFFGKS